MSNQDYKNAALAALKGNWAPAVLASVIFVLITLIVVSPSEISAFTQLQPKTSLSISGGVLLLYIFVYFPLVMGFFNTFRSLLDEGDTELTHNMFACTLDKYGHNVLGMGFMYLKVVLWSLLFIIPGIVMDFAYAMTPYILKDNPELSAWEASSRSREMMKGHKFDLFWLELSFIGWILLSILTLGIGLFWLVPYMQTAIAAFYNDISGKNAPVAVEAAPVAKEVPAETAAVVEEVPAEAAPAVEAAPAENAEN